MTVRTACPTPDRLQQLALGLVDDAALDLLSRHVQDCELCSGVLPELRASDPLADALGCIGRVAVLVPRGPIVDNAIQQACRLNGSRSAIASQDTSGNPLDTGRSDAKASKTDPAQIAAQILSPPQSAGEIGRLGPYRVLKLLDSGGMGIVFLAEDSKLQRLVALKVMKPALGATDDARQRFLREARAAAALRHDNIVTIYQVGEDRGSPWLAMELLEGQSLGHRLLRDRRLAVAEAVAIGRQIAKALAMAHARGLIHRDIKPANVWLEMPTSRVKVLDFGLARVESEGAGLTEPGIVVGTPAYMAPEQARGDVIDHRSDLFSLGCVLYHALAGASPFRGKDTLAVLTALVEHTPPSLRSLGLQIPALLDDLIARLLAKNPDSRPRSAIEVDEALAQIEAQLTSSPQAVASDPADDRLSPRSMPAAGFSQVPSLQVATRSSSRHWPLALGAAAAAAGLAVLGTALAPRSPEPSIAAKSDAPSSPAAAVTGIKIAAPAAYATETDEPKSTLPPILAPSDTPAPAVLTDASPTAVQIASQPAAERVNDDPLALPTVKDTVRPTAPTASTPSSVLPRLVSIQTNKPVQTIVGELGRKNDRYIEVADLKTGKMQPYAIADLRNIDNEVSDQAAIDAAGLSNYMAWRIKQVLPRADAAGTIVQLDGAMVLVSLGKSAGLEPGQELNVFRSGPEIKDPDTGKVLGKQRPRIARLQVVEVQGEQLSKAKLLGDLETSLQTLDEVQPANVNNLIAVLPLVNDDNVETPAGKKIAEELTTGLVKRGIPVVERRLLDQVLGELGRQKAKDFDQSKVQRAGMQLGAYAVVVGTMSSNDRSHDVQLRLVKVATGEIMFSSSPTIRISEGPTPGTDPKRNGKMAPLPRAPRGSRLRWLGASVHSPAPLPTIAPHFNLIHDRSWDSGDDSVIREARRAGRKVILGVYRSDYPKLTDTLLRMARDNRDVVTGICLITPYDKHSGLSVAELGQLGRHLKTELPGISFWASYIEMPAGMSEPLPPVPPEVDVVEVQIYFDMSPDEVTVKVDKCLPQWLKRAGDRPVVLRWISRPEWSWKSSHGPMRVAPGTFKRCAAMAEKYNLAGLTFDKFGPGLEDWTYPIDSIPAAMGEIKELSKQYGFTQK